jgi:hypothetical protein
LSIGFERANPVEGLPKFESTPTPEQTMRIKNINGTAENRCSCGSWLNHWERFSRQVAYTCSVPGCKKSEIVGAHVQISGDQNWYICPLCSSHNKQSDEL